MSHEAEARLSIPTFMSLGGTSDLATKADDKTTIKYMLGSKQCSLSGPAKLVKGVSTAISFATSQNPAWTRDISCPTMSDDGTITFSETNTNDTLHAGLVLILTHLNAFSYDVSFTSAATVLTPSAALVKALYADSSGSIKAWLIKDFVLVYQHTEPLTFKDCADPNTEELDGILEIERDPITLVSKEKLYFLPPGVPFRVCFNVEIVPVLEFQFGGCFGDASLVLHGRAVVGANLEVSAEVALTMLVVEFGLQIKLDPLLGLSIQADLLLQVLPSVDAQILFSFNVQPPVIKFAVVWRHLTIAWCGRFIPYPCGIEYSDWEDVWSISAGFANQNIPIWSSKAIPGAANNTFLISCSAQTGKTLNIPVLVANTQTWILEDNPWIMVTHANDTRGALIQPSPAAYGTYALTGFVRSAATTHPLTLTVEVLPNWDEIDIQMSIEYGAKDYTRVEVVTRGPAFDWDTVSVYVDWPDNSYFKPTMYSGISLRKLSSTYVNMPRTDHLFYKLFARLEIKDAISTRTVYTAIEVTEPHLNHAPQLSLDGPNHFTLKEDSYYKITGVVYDPDGSRGSVQLKIDVDGSMLIVPASQVFKVVLSTQTDQSSVLVLEGAFSDLNELCVNGFYLQPKPNLNGNFTLTVTIEDQGNIGLGNSKHATVTRAITVVPQPDKMILLLKSEEIDDDNAYITGTAWHPDSDAPLLLHMTHSDGSLSGLNAFTDNCADESKRTCIITTPGDFNDMLSNKTITYTSDGGANVELLEIDYAVQDGSEGGWSPSTTVFVPVGAGGPNAAPQLYHSSSPHWSGTAYASGSSYFLNLVLSDDPYPSDCPYTASITSSCDFTFDVTRTAGSYVITAGYSDMVTYFANMALHPTEAGFEVTITVDDNACGFGIGGNKSVTLVQNSGSTRITSLTLSDPNGAPFGDELHRNFDSDNFYDQNDHETTYLYFNETTGVPEVDPNYSISKDDYDNIYASMIWNGDCYTDQCKSNLEKGFKKLFEGKSQNCRPGSRFSFEIYSNTDSDISRKFYLDQVKSDYPTEQTLSPSVRHSLSHYSTNAQWWCSGYNTYLNLRVNSFQFECDSAGEFKFHINYDKATSTTTGLSIIVPTHSVEISHEIDQLTVLQRVTLFTSLTVSNIYGANPEYLCILNVTSGILSLPDSEDGSDSLYFHDTLTNIGSIMESVMIYSVKDFGGSNPSLYITLKGPIDDDLTRSWVAFEEVVTLDTVFPTNLGPTIKWPELKNMESNSEQMMYFSIQNPSIAMCGGEYTLKVEISPATAGVLRSPLEDEEDPDTDYVWERTLSYDFTLVPIAYIANGYFGELTLSYTVTDKIPLPGYPETQHQGTGTLTVIGTGTNTVITCPYPASSDEILTGGTFDCKIDDPDGQPIDIGVSTVYNNTVIEYSGANVTMFNYSVTPDVTHGEILTINYYPSDERKQFDVIQVWAKDSTHQGDAVQVVIELEPMNDPPVITGDTELDCELGLSCFPSLEVSDPDAGEDDVQLILTLTGNGSMEFSTSDAVELVCYNDHNLCYLFGPISELNSTLETLRISTNISEFDDFSMAEASTYSQTASLNVTVDDLGSFGGGPKQVTSHIITLNYRHFNVQPTITNAPGKIYLVPDKIHALSLEFNDLDDEDVLASSYSVSGSCDESCRITHSGYEYSELTLRDATLEEIAEWWDGIGIISAEDETGYLNVSINDGGCCGFNEVQPVPSHTYSIQVEVIPKALPPNVTFENQTVPDYYNATAMNLSIAYEDVESFYSITFDLPSGLTIQSASCSDSICVSHVEDPSMIASYNILPGTYNVTANVTTFVSQSADFISLITWFLVDITAPRDGLSVSVDSSTEIEENSEGYFYCLVSAASMNDTTPAAILFHLHGLTMECNGIVIQQSNMLESACLFETVGYDELMTAANEVRTIEALQYFNGDAIIIVTVEITDNMPISDSAVRTVTIEPTASPLVLNGTIPLHTFAENETICIEFPVDLIWDPDDRSTGNFSWTYIQSETIVMGGNFSKSLANVSTLVELKTLLSDCRLNVSSKEYYTGETSLTLILIADGLSNEFEVPFNVTMINHTPELVVVDSLNAHIDRPTRISLQIKDDAFRCPEKSVNLNIDVSHGGEAYVSWLHNNATARSLALSQTTTMMEGLSLSFIPEPTFTGIANISVTYSDDGGCQDIDPHSVTATTSVYVLIDEDVDIDPEPLSCVRYSSTTRRDSVVCRIVDTRILLNSASMLFSTGENWLCTQQDDFLECGIVGFTSSVFVKKEETVVVNVTVSIDDETTVIDRTTVTPLSDDDDTDDDAVSACNDNDVSLTTEQLFRCETSTGNVSIVSTCNSVVEYLSTYAHQPIATCLKLVIDDDTVLIDRNNSSEPAAVTLSESSILVYLQQEVQVNYTEDHECSTFGVYVGDDNATCYAMGSTSALVEVDDAQRQTVSIQQGSNKPVTVTPSIIAEIEVDFEVSALSVEDSINDHYFLINHHSYLNCTWCDDDSCVNTTIGYTNSTTIEVTCQHSDGDSVTRTVSLAYHSSIPETLRCIPGSQVQICDYSEGCVVLSCDNVQTYHFENYEVNLRPLTRIPAFTHGSAAGHSAVIPSTSVDPTILVDATLGVLDSLDYTMEEHGQYDIITEFEAGKVTIDSANGTFNVYVPSVPSSCAITIQDDIVFVEDCFSETDVFVFKFVFESDTATFNQYSFSPIYQIPAGCSLVEVEVKSSLGFSSILTAPESNAGSTTTISDDSRTFDQCAELLEIAIDYRFCSNCEPCYGHPSLRFLAKELIQVAVESDDAELLREACRYHPCNETGIVSFPLSTSNDVQICDSDGMCWIVQLTAASFNRPGLGIVTLDIVDGTLVFDADLAELSRFKSAVNSEDDVWSDLAESEEEIEFESTPIIVIGALIIIGLIWFAVTRRRKDNNPSNADVDFGQSMHPISVRPDAS